MIAKGENHTIQIAFRGGEEDLVNTCKGLINVVRCSCMMEGTEPPAEDILMVLNLLEDLLPEPEQLCLGKK